MFYFFLAVLTYWPISFAGYALQYDAIDVYLPWRFFGSESMQNGMVPLWNPYQDGGYPFYADLQYSIWNPEFFIGSLFGRFNATTISWMFLLYSAIGGLGFNKLLKVFEFNNSVAFLGGCIFMLSGVFVGHAQSIISILGVIWLPWALYSYIKLLRNNFYWKDILTALICLLLMLVAGYQAVSLMLFYVLLTIGLVHFIQLIQRRDGKLILRFLGAHLLLGIGLTGLMLGTIVSIVEVSPYLARLDGLSIESTSKILFHPKSLISVLFPLASVQQEYVHSAISAQNIFCGTAIIGTTLVGFKYLKNFLSKELVILLIFGVVYGLASFGNFTPVQPFLANIVPGFDQFYYANFYRLFSWIALLIIGMYGLQIILDQGRMQFTKWLFIVGTLFFAGVFGLNSTRVISAFNDGLSIFGDSLRTLSQAEAMGIQGLIHFLLFAIFLVLFWKLKRKKYLLPVFMVLELVVITQLNIPVTVVGAVKSKTINTYLSTKAVGFPKVNIDVPLKENGSNEQYVNLWRNQGNFINEPKLAGFTSFHLKDRDLAYDEGDGFADELNNKPWAYLTSNDAKLSLKEFSPTHYLFEIETDSITNFVLQQSKYPGWMVLLDGKPVNPKTVNKFEQQLTIQSGQHTIEFSFENKWIERLFYLNHIGFLALLIVVLVVNSKVSVKQKWIASTGLLVVLTVLISLMLRKSLINGEVVVYSEGRDIWSINQHITPNQKQDLVNKLSSISSDFSVDFKHFDIDPDILAIFNSFYKDYKIDDRVYFKNRVENKRAQQDSILSQGFYEFEVSAIPRNKPLFLTFSGQMSSAHYQNLSLVIDVKDSNQQVMYKLIELKGEAVYSGAILPEINDEQQLKVYLWNQSDETISFSNLKLDTIELIEAK